MRMDGLTDRQTERHSDTARERDGMRLIVIFPNLAIAPKTRWKEWFYALQLDTHTHPVELFWTSHQLVSEVATYKTHKQNRRIFMMSAGFELATPLNEWLSICALDYTATRVGGFVLKF